MLDPINRENKESKKSNGSSRSLLHSLLPKPNYPIARVPQGKRDGRRRECPCCSEPIIINFWDSINGFLVNCPHCKCAVGKPWNLRSKMRWGFLLVTNFIGLFFTLRPKAALIASGGFVAFWLLEPLGLSSITRGPQETPLMLLAFFVPWLISIVASIRHEVHRSHPRIRDPWSQDSSGTADP